jgi:hypothetical protein
VSQQCVACVFGLVSTSTGATSCTACPPRYAWLNASLCEPCPTNSITNPNSPAACACTGGYYDTLFGSAPASPVCDVCPIGGACTSGYVAAAEGYWRENNVSDVLFKCREGNCMEEEVYGPLSANVSSAVVAARRHQASANTSTAQCPYSSLDTFSNCAEGNCGPLCAICKPGYALQSGKCAPCDPSSAWDAWRPGDKAALLACCCVFAIVVVLIAFFQPIIPSLETAVGNAAESARAAAQRITGSRSQQPGAEPEKPHPQPIHNHAGGSAAATIGTDVAIQLQAAEIVRASAGAGTTVEDMDNFMKRMGKLAGMLQSASKIVVNFYQIASTFLKSLDIPWPHAFGVVMARVNVVNLNLVQLPKTACLNPSPSYYKQFNGYTLGLMFAILFIKLLELFGTRLLARVTLRLLSEHERTERLACFRNDLLARLLLLLFMVYPGVSVAIFGIFSCTKLSSGMAFLDADLTVLCYTKKHWGYMGAGVIWVFVYTFGIPAFFIHLLRKYHVPLLAKTYKNNALLFEATKIAALRGLPLATQGDEPPNVDSVTDAQLGALIALLVLGVSVEQAANILAGKAEAPNVAVEEAAEEKEGLPLKRRLSKFIKSSVASVLKSMCSRRVAKKIMSAEEEAAVDATKRREAALSRLMRWCRTSGQVGVPMLHWSKEEGGEMTEKEGKVHKDELKHAPEKNRQAKAWAAAHLQELEERAKQKVGFLFVAYTPSCWYWEVVELVRKLALTSVLALIAPGSAGQVVVGLLLALFALLANLAFLPFESSTLNRINQLAQLNLVMLLLVALLMKVNLDGEGSSYFFTGIVAFLTIFPVFLPVVLQAVTFFTDDDDAAEDGGDAQEDSAWG